MRRSAQDDGFVAGVEIQLVDAENTKRSEKVTGSQDDDFVGIWTKNILNKLALVGRHRRVRVRLSLRKAA